MKQIFEIYLQNSIGLSVIGILLFAVSPFLSRRYSAKCRYSLWLIVLFALILPVHPQISIPVPGMMQLFVPDAGNLAGIRNGNSAAAAPDFWRTAAFLWACGALCLLLWYSFLHLRFLSAIRRWSSEISPEKMEGFRRVKTEMGIGQDIPIRSCACIRTPMMVGLLKPVILFPEIDLSPDEFTFIVRHELVHYKRKDLYSKILIMLALILHWFNPVVHIMIRSALGLCEISCDEEVLRGTGSRIRARYGETIIGVIQKGKTYQTSLSTNFYSRSGNMKKRIYAMMDMRRKRFSVPALCLVACITFCGISAFALTVQSQQSVFRSGQTASENLKPLAGSADSAVSSHSSAGPAKDSENKNRIVPENENPKLVPGGQTVCSSSQTASDRLESGIRLS